MEWIHWLGPALVILVAGVFQGSSGFGFAILAAPLLLFVYPAHFAIPLCACLGLAANLAMTLKCWRRVDVRLLLGWALGSLFGLPVGLLIYAFGSRRTLELLAGLLMPLVIASILWHRGNEHVFESRTITSVAFGVPAGILGAALSMPGPPLAAHAAWSRTRHSTFQATAPAFGIAVSCLALTGYVALGYMSTDLTIACGILAGPLGLGVGIGLLLGRHLSQRLFQDLLILMLGVVAFLLLWGDR